MNEVTALKQPEPPANLHSQYPDAEELSDVTIMGYRFVMRPPTEDEYEMFQSSISGDQSTMPKAARSLALTCAVWPGRQEVEKAFKSRAGLPIKLTKVVQQLAGIHEEATVKKFGGV